MLDPIDPIAEAAQQVIDRDWPGWSLANYVMVVGVARIDDDGRVATTIGLYQPVGQPDYTTLGLLVAGNDLREQAEQEERE